MTDKQYAMRNAMDLDAAGGHYVRHVLAMTAEQLHSKGDIAAELGWRDMQIAALQEQVQKLGGENSTLIGWIEMDTMTSIDRTAFSATEAVIREIGAKAVDGFAVSLGGATELWHPVDAVEEYAAKFRAGEVS